MKHIKNLALLAIYALFAMSVSADDKESFETDDFSANYSIFPKNIDIPNDILLASSSIDIEPHQNAEPVELEENSKKLSRRDVLKYVGISGTFQLGAIATIGLTSKEDLDDLKPHWAFYVSALGEHLPLYALNKEKAQYYTGAELGFLGAHLATRNVGPNSTMLPLHLFFNTASYSTYETYKEARKIAREDAYKGDWRGHELPELFKASFKQEHWEDPWMWGVMAFAVITGAAEKSSSKDGIWKTGVPISTTEKFP